MSDRILPRIGAASGALFVVLIFLTPIVSPRGAIALVLELTGLILFIPFLGYLWSVIREAEGGAGWLSTTALAAGIVGITIKLASVAPGFAASRQEGLSPQLHEALDTMNSVAFIAQMLPLGVLMAAVAIVILRTRVLPSWLGWLAALSAPALYVNGMFLDAEFGPAFLLFLLWVFLTSTVLAIHSASETPGRRSLQPAQAGRARGAANPAASRSAPRPT